MRRISVRKGRPRYVAMVSLTLERHDDVTRLHMQSVAGRVIGISVSAYVLDGTLIDTGFWRARNALAAAIGGLGVRGAVLTHWHEDHAGNTSFLARRGLPLSMSRETEAPLRRGARVRAYRRLTWGQP